jgi:hypothetical protein
MIELNNEIMQESAKLCFSEISIGDFVNESLSGVSMSWIAAI